MRLKWVEMLVLGFVLGVLLRSFFIVSFSATLFILIVSATLIFFRERFFRNSIIFLYIALVFLGGVVGIVRFQLSEPTDVVLHTVVGEPVVLEAIVARAPDKRDALTFIVLETESVEIDGVLQTTSERVRIAVDSHAGISYGDHVSVSGMLQEPENFQTDGGRFFDYRSYLAKDNIYFEMFRPDIDILATDKGNPLIEVLLRFKVSFLHSIEERIPEPESALLGGLLLGEKHSLGDSLTENFRRSGLVHIIVLSGYNMTIVAYAIMWMLSRLPKGIAAGAGTLGIIAFTIMAGGSATAVRAAIMALLVILARVVGRDYDIGRALAVAGFAMIIHNPKILAFDPSFQLSFLATIGIIYLAPLFERHLKIIPTTFGLREIVAATFATQIFVLPRLIDLSGAVSLISVLANILVLPVIPITMLFGALAGFAGFIHSAIALPFSYLAYFFLHYIVSVADFLGSLSWASLSIAYMPVWMLLTSYSVLFAILYRVFMIQNRKLD